MALAFNILFHQAFEQELRRRLQRIRSRQLRDQSNPFAIPETAFKKLYRLPQAIVLGILIPAVEPFINVGQRSTYIPIHLKVLATLHFLAQGAYQASVGTDNLIAMGQSTVSKIIKEIVEILAINLLPHYVKFPTDANHVLRVKQGFQNKFNFPGILGAIDCTHVAIVSPPANDPVQPALAYFNRKGFYSVNVQTICDSDLLILAINARYPGATHDAAIWQLSSINRYLQRRFEEGNLDSWLLGDSGYPLAPYMMTPIMGVQDINRPEGRYNYRHAQARNVIERCFGVLKQRFRCLLKHRVLHYSHRKAGLIIYACAVLHNILIQQNVRVEDVDEDETSSEESNDEEVLNDYNINVDILATGRRIRNNLVARF